MHYIIGDNMNKSIWGFDKSSYNYTKKNIDCDVLIIGGGMCGMTTLLMLLDSNKKVVLIDSNRVGSGITNKTTGKISVMQGYNYQNISKISKNLAYDYMHSQVYSTKKLVRLIKEFNIPCDLSKNSSYLFTNSNDNIKKIVNEKNLLDKVLKCEIIDSLPNGYPCLYGIKSDHSFVFNPIKYISFIKNLCKDKMDIYEYTRALSITRKLDYFLVKTNKNKIKAKQIVICTHYPILVKKLFFPIVTSITKEYVVCGETQDVHDSNMFYNDDNVISMRYYGNSMIYASGNDLLGDRLNHKKNINSVIKDFKRHFNYPIKYTWYNYDITSTDYLPIIGEVEKNIYVATAFNKWGMTNSVLSASILSDLIKGKKNRYADIFSINRKSLINSYCIRNMFDNVVTFFKPKKRNISYEYIDGIKYAVYTDINGIQHKIIDKCPHLGCGLIFNEVDKTWDCPCHGSRYDIDGKVIHGPSNMSIKKK